MVEGVNTGGVKKFVYSSGNSPKLSLAEKKEIEEAYVRAAERKEKERKRKIISWIGIALGVILLIILGLIFIR